MEPPLPLLDTPKKIKLQSRVDDLKIDLKAFERAFAAQHKGQKPGREDIKANAGIQAKYTEHGKLRGVLDGKLSIEVLNNLSQQEQNARNRQRKHRRTDSAISIKPHSTNHNQTPSKGRYHPSQLDPYDAPQSASPKAILREVGPTPHRNGTILGIFDMLHASGGSRKSSQETPSGSKRKRDALHEDDTKAKDLELTISQTPRHEKSIVRDTQLAATTPKSGPATGRRNHSKTPVSESKRFMLQHFFTTPSAVRFATMLQDESTPHAKTPVDKTPLRDQVLGISPSRTPTATADATPPYLKRSFSFKERLLSASDNNGSPTSSHRKTSPGSTRTMGTRRTQQTKFVPKPLSQIIADRASQQTQDQHGHNDHDGNSDDDDDLDAMREIELQEAHVLVGDSQRIGPLAPSHGDEQQGRVWKKKGQKRTTRRAVMRPTKMKPVEGPKFVAADEDEDEDTSPTDHEASRVEETQYIPDEAYDDFPEPDDDELEYLIAEAERTGQSKDRHENSKPSSYIDEEDLDEDFLPEPVSVNVDVDIDIDIESPIKRRKKSDSSKPARWKTQTEQSKSKKKKNQGDDDDNDDNTTTRKINPNAQSHMNFRSLKIRNKNSKAKGAAGRGKGRFGRGRR
ncbi:hypothetical protein LTR84_011359 [Exophiala bonariae]|uniref:DNA replication regulator SLD2 n=1 Tax=Exophiala bonariae TaxID=1690606 RepID=A0AAV9MS73_9EURO|nr:hypothetical protein LTR84_011359 [Exophiala bonariae]